MKPQIMVHGKDLIDDDSFLQLVKKNADVLLLEDIDYLKQHLDEIHSKLLIFEFSESFEEDLLNLKLLKAAAPFLEILVIDDGLSRDEVIRAFRSGIKDYFKKPYNTRLLVERIEALLRFHENDRAK
ncbi:MAG: DNA-binding response regulator [Calditrichaeota bacterium]|nr:response regulator transcription factor [Calditrichota bacterium]RQW04738.1 MAG: DNA-binding response regulator [Calditrichota bacterium]